jgi:putative endonuclease
MSTDRPKRTAPRQVLGQQGERLAASWYRQHGYRIVARNWRCRNGELDLVLSTGDTLVFCEVKARSSRRFGHPVEAVTALKQSKIRRLALQFMSSTRTRRRRLRFDVATVEDGRVEIWRDAF